MRQRNAASEDSIRQMFLFNLEIGKASSFGDHERKVSA